MKKPELQELALSQDVAIYHPEGHEKEGKELTVPELKEAVEAKVAELETAHADDQAEADAARESVADEPTDEPTDDEPEETPKEKAVREANEAMHADAKKTRTRRARRAAAADPEAGILAKMGVKVSQGDRTMAAKHGYPVAVPGGKPYVTRAGFNCSFGGGYRHIDTIVLLTDAEAAHKSEFITAL